MANIIYSTQCVMGQTALSARIVPTPQYVGGKEGSVVRVDVLTASETPVGGGWKIKAKQMHTAYWLTPDEAISLAEALKAAAVLAKHHDEADQKLFLELEVRRAMQ